MKIFVALVVFIVLYEGVEPRSRSGTTRRYSSVKPTRYYDSDSDSDDESSSDDDTSDESSSDDSSDDSDTDDDYGCPSVNQIMGNGISTVCLNGILFINGKEIKNVDSTDRIDVIGTEVRVNGKFIGKIPSSNNRYKNKGSTGSRTAKKQCPDVMMNNCKNVSRSCINGQLYINEEKIKVKPTDSVVIDSNNLRINGKFIRRFPSSKKSNTNRKSEEGPSVVMNSCNGVSTYKKNGKFFINDFELKNYKPTDKIRINNNDVYVNGKFIRHIKPKKIN